MPGSISLSREAYYGLAFSLRGLLARWMIFASEASKMCTDAEGFSLIGACYVLETYDC